MTVSYVQDVIKTYQVVILFHAYNVTFISWYHLHLFLLNVT